MSRTDYPCARVLIAGATAALKARTDEVNRLNVFPVPDGDTGTNMSLTCESVVADVTKLGDDASLTEVCRAATHGSLMGARGNSGVILSQIVRGCCEGLTGDAAAAADTATERVALALEQAKVVAWQAVRKPVEGTILTVISDMAGCAREQADAGADVLVALESIAAAAHASVRRTPELMPLLKEAGVVDAGGFGLAILFDAFVALLSGREVADIPDFTPVTELTVVPVDDWDDDEYLYCTEFLLFGDGIDKETVHDYIAARGGSELVVGDAGQYKVHVHTDNPAEILTYALSLGEIAEVHVHNMRRQQAERPGEHPGARAGAAGTAAASAPAKAVGVVAVASGSGLATILTSLGVDVVVTGGQTMNPSTEDLVRAAETVNADAVILLPNNKNIVMAAQAAADALDKPAQVVATRSVPEAFSALLNYDPESDDLDGMADEMRDAAGEVRTGEITTAIKDSKGNVGTIKEGDTIGIVDGKEIEAVGKNVGDVACDLLQVLDAADAETLTLLAGEDYTDRALKALVKRIEKQWPNLEIDAQRGEQPLYPLILAVE
ncbi:MAG: DAK2 domain-containing protein [Actinomycetes bacterium]|jgi:DAK2 domain fusion protein YloV|nr:DAK2 domain-containing protein [Actinomycetes bacterium]